jgi:hypothetical protein
VNKPFRIKTITLFQQRGVLGLLTLDKRRVASGFDFHLAQHLTNDDLNVLVIDLHTLQAVNLLNLIDNVFGQCRNAFESENVMRG